MAEHEWTEHGKPIPFPDEPEVHHAWEWREQQAWVARYAAEHARRMDERARHVD